MITADAQQLEPGGRVTVYELDASSFGADQLFFHAHLQSGVIWWQGQEYGAWPIEATGFERTSDQPPNPRLKVGNLDGRIAAMCMLYGDMVGAKVIRRQTLVKYLDAANFPLPLNKVRNSANPIGSTWLNLGASSVSAPPRTADGITFNGPARIASAGAAFNRRTTTLAGAPLVEAGETFAVTAYFAFGSSGAGRLHITNQAASGVKDGTVQFSAGSATPTVTNQGAGQISVREYRDFGDGVRKLVLTVTFAENGTGTPTFGLGPNSATTGADITLLGMQVQTGAVATPFEVTSADPSKDRNPTADPNEHFLAEIWFIERKVSETKEVVEFELTTAIDLNGEQLPGRQIISGVCGWLIRCGYRGPFCGYTGPAVADANDVPTTDPARDQCGGRVGSCKLRFGADKPLPYGGFPASGLLRT